MDFSKEYLEELLKQTADMGAINVDEYPNIDLYMDQVTTFMEQHLASYKRYEDDKILTKTMINNYAKSSLLPAPEKKKYTPEHMYLLFYIYHMKNVLSINDIQTLLSPLEENFFNQSQAEPSMKEIYSRVASEIAKQNSKTADDISKMFDQSAALFSDDNQDHYLSMFAMASLLCYDISIKKHLLEQISDDLNAALTKQREEAAAAAKKSKR